MEAIVEGMLYLYITSLSKNVMPCHVMLKGFVKKGSWTIILSSSSKLIFHGSHGPGNSGKVREFEDGQGKPRKFREF